MARSALRRADSAGEPRPDYPGDCLSAAERTHGGLALVVERRLRALAQELEVKATRALVPAPLQEPGTRLLREWGGKRQHCRRAGARL